MNTELRARLDERDAALTTLDLNWARKLLPEGTSDEILLTSMHKARYDCTAIAPELRHASGDWLRSRGLTRIAGLEWPPTGELP
jgi:hypothetical protein